MSKYTPDHIQAIKFFKTLYRSDDPVVTIRVIKETAKHTKPTNAKIAVLSEQTPHWTRLQNQQYGIFFTPNDTDGMGTNDENITSYNAVWIDIDSGELPDIKDFALPPSAIISRSDGLGHHVYWFYSYPSADEEKWRAAQGSLIYFYKSDSVIKNPARLMRVPGTYNYKPKYPAPLMYQLVLLNDKRYTPDDIIMSHTSEEKRIKRAKKILSSFMPNEKMSDGEGRHKFMIQCAFVLNDYGVQGEAALKELQRINKKYLADPYSEAELNQIAASQKYAKSEAGHAATEEAIRLERRKDTLRALLEKWYYVHVGDYFINADEPFNRPRSKENFNASYSSIAEQNNAVGFIFRYDLIKHAEQLTYEPGKPVVLVEGDKTLINLYQPPTIEESTGTTPDWFIDHVKLLLPDEKEHTHFLDFLAYLIQNPGAKVMHAILIIGSQGIGKSALLGVFQKIFGLLNVGVPSEKTIGEPYTSWAKHLQLAFIHELDQGDKMDLINRLKPIITERNLEIREMFHEAYTIPNHINIIIASNPNQPINLERGDRRWMIMRSPAEIKEDSDKKKWLISLDTKLDSEKYFKKFFEHITNDSNDVYWYLKQRDISKFNPYAAPFVTEAKQFILQQSKTDLQIYIEDAITDLTPPFHTDFVCVEEVMNELPMRFRNSKYVTGKRIASIFRDIGAHYIPDLIKVNKQNKRFWIVRNIEKNKRMEAEELRKAIRACYAIGSDALDEPFHIQN